nr:unnamed protein product [Digitaria exilis]
MMQPYMLCVVGQPEYEVLDRHGAQHAAAHVDGRPRGQEMDPETDGDDARSPSWLLEAFICEKMASRHVSSSSETLFAEVDTSELCTCAGGLCRAGVHRSPPSGEYALFAMDSLPEIDDLLFEPDDLLLQDRDFGQKLQRLVRGQARQSAKRPRERSLQSSVDVLLVTQLLPQLDAFIATGAVFELGGLLWSFSIPYDLSRMEYQIGAALYRDGSNRAHLKRAGEKTQNAKNSRTHHHCTPWGLELKAASFPIRARQNAGKPKIPPRQPARQDGEGQGISSSRSGAQLNERRQLSRRRSPRKKERGAKRNETHGMAAAQGLLTFSFLGATLVAARAPRPTAAAAGLRALPPFIVSNGVCIRRRSPRRRRGGVERAAGTRAGAEEEVGRTMALLELGGGRRRTDDADRARGWEFGGGGGDGDGGVAGWVHDEAFLIWTGSIESLVCARAGIVGSSNIFTADHSAGWGGGSGRVGSARGTRLPRARQQRSALCYFLVELCGGLEAGGVARRRGAEESALSTPLARGPAASGWGRGREANDEHSVRSRLPPAANSYRGFIGAQPTNFTFCSLGGVATHRLAYHPSTPSGLRSIGACEIKTRLSPAGRPASRPRHNIAGIFTKGDRGEVCTTSPSLQGLQQADRDKVARGPQKVSQWPPQHRY